MDRKLKAVLFLVLVVVAMVVMVVCGMDVVVLLQFQFCRSSGSMAHLWTESKNGDLFLLVVLVVVHDSGGDGGVWDGRGGA